MIKKMIVALLILTLLSCEEEEPTNQACTENCIVIQGRFTTEDGTVGVPSLPLKLGWVKPGMLGGDSRNIATGRTDANGYYAFTFAPKDKELVDGSFSISFSVSDNFLSSPNSNYFEIFGIKQPDTTVSVNYHLPQKATIELVLLNPSDIVPPDYISAAILYNFDNLENDIQALSGELDTRNSNQPAITLSTAGGQYTYVETTKEKNGTVEIMLDSLIVPSGEKVVYELTF